MKFYGKKEGVMAEKDWINGEMGQNPTNGFIEIGGNLTLLHLKWWM